MQYCGREFSEQELSWLKALIADEPDISRKEISRKFCERLRWRKPDGGLKDMSCSVALLRMNRDGLISLPATKRTPRKLSRQVRRTSAGEPRKAICEKVGDFHLQLDMVDKRNSVFWNELIDRYHYLGYTPLPGAQLRYIVNSQYGSVALLGFSACAWAAADRDKYIGWDGYLRKKNLRFIVNNSRFLILPWVQSKGLASRILAMATRQLADDWQKRYKYRPVLAETFVEKSRFKGTCYHAAGWVCVGQTKGRGKLDSRNQRALPIKTIWLKPLEKDWRKPLFGGNRCRIRKK